MSRIRGIDAKVQKEVLQTRRNGGNENNKKRNEDQSSCPERHQINELLYKLPKLNQIFEVHRKIGEGTFSSVYLGSLRQHASLPVTQKRWYAIKHLVPTSHPARIEHELRCLQDIGGKNNVIGVELCLRHFDTIVFIMPYIPHRKFSEYVGEMDADELRRYLRALLTALRHVHSFGVIHRDVKPSNFLYDRENRRYLLVDFGLAQRVAPPPPPPPPPAHLASKRPRDEKGESPEAKRVALDLTVGLRGEPAPAGVPTPVPVPAPVARQQQNIMPKSAAITVSVAEDAGDACACRGVPRVCARCAARPPPRAPRAGTQGFRPPEVLLKFGAQTTAVDVWACGVVACSVLAARYPLFRAPDDAAALAELAQLHGTAPLQRAAHALGRRLLVSSQRPPLCLRKLCARLRGVPPPPARPPPPPAAACERCCLPAAECLCLDESKPAWEFDPESSTGGFPDAAFALVARLLEPDPRRRPCAARALAHPFLRD